MENKKIYYSRMNQTPETTFLSEVAVLTQIFGISEVTFHGGGQYHEDKLINAKIVIVTGSNNEFVGRGVFAEINTALLNKIPVFQFFKRSSGGFNGTVIFRRIVGCDIHDVTDYYLNFGKCNYYQVQQEDLKISINQLMHVLNSSDIQAVRMLSDRKPDPDDF